MTHLAITLYLNKLYQEQNPKIALAGDGSFIDNVIGGVKEYVSSLWDSNKPLASIVSFLGPGLLFKLGFPWLAVAYEVASALGFDWIGFWDSIKTAVVDIVKGAMAPGAQKPTEEEVHRQVAAATDESLRQNVKDTVDEDKLQKAYEKTQENPIPASASNFKKDNLIKEGGLFSAAARSRGMLTGLFKKIIPWVITRALIALGFAVGGGALRGAVGIKSGPKEDGASEGGGSSSEAPVPKVREPIYNLQLSPSADPDLFEFNKNDASSVWLENGNINNIKSILSGWIFSAFPNLSNEADKITNSSSFIEVENMFRNRNKMAQGLQIYSVPKPFQKKIEIVSYIVNGYLKNRGN